MCRYYPVVILTAIATATGCSRTASKPSNTERADPFSRSSSEPLTEIIDLSSLSNGSKPITHDFGAQLSDGRELRHTFRVRNTSNSQLHIIESKAHTPCCSTIGPLPTAVLAQRVVEIPTTLIPRSQLGRRHVEFTVRTDSEEHPLWRFELVANHLPDVELHPVDPSGRDFVLLKDGGRWIWRVTTRRKAAHSLARPSSINISKPLSASFISDPNSQLIVGNLREITRDIEISVPRSGFGHHRADLVVLMEDDTSTSAVVSWEEPKPVRANPSGIVLFPEKGKVDYTLLIESADVPFRICEIKNPLSKAQLPALQGESLRLHSVKLQMDPSRISKDKRSTSIHIKTDHPHQPDVIVSVLILPGEEKGNQ